MVFGGFGSGYSSAFTTQSGTQRYLWPSTATAGEHGDLIQDAAGAATVTLTGTLSVTKPWSAIGVDLIASNALSAPQNIVYAVEMTLQGTGYYSMVGIPNHWLPVNTNVYPQSLGATRDSYTSPAWDANATVGASGGSAISTLTWSHTNAANAYVLVSVVEYTVGGNPTITCTYGGVSMTRLGSVLSGTYFTQYLFGLSVAGSGAHTVAVSSTQVGFMSGRSTSFTGVTGVGTFNSSSGSSASPSVAQFQNAGDVFFGSVASFAGGITVTAGNNPWTVSNTDTFLAGGWLPMTQASTAGGFAQVSGTASSGTWTGVGIPLLGIETTPGNLGSAPAYSSNVPWIGLGGKAGITQQTPTTTEVAVWFGNANNTTGNTPTPYPRG
jgi:hypothetical protein